MSKKGFKFEPKPSEFIGNIIFSAIGLRRMANALQKNHKTKGDVTVKTYIHKWHEGRKLCKTLGIKVK